jgi:hypothetical protein
MNGAFRIFSKVCSGGISTTVSSGEFFSTTVEAEEGRILKQLSPLDHHHH